MNKKEAIFQNIIEILHKFILPIVRKNKMMLIIFLALLFQTVWTKDTFEIPGVRVLMVSDSNPSDGQIRILRSANARNYAVNLLKVHKSDTEVAETLKYLETIGSNDMEILFLTPSDTMFMTQEAMIFALKVSHVALMGGGSVVMPYPKKNVSSIPTKYDEEILDLEEILEIDFEFTKNFPRPITYLDWQKSIRPYAKLRYLKVKARQEQRKKSSMYNNRFCALTGLTIAVKESLRTFLENPLTNGTGSLKNLCDKVVTFGSLRHEMQVVFDDEAKVFNFASERPKGNIIIAYSQGHDGSTNIFSQDYDITPIIFDSHDQIPFDISNMASGEIGIKSKPCQICPDNKIPDLEIQFGSRENYPLVHMIVPKSVDILDFDKFIENIMNLTYPKTRTMLSFVMSYENDSSYVKELLSKANGEIGKLYNQTAILSGFNIPPLTIFEKMWEMATTHTSDYIFIVDPTTRFSDLEVIEHLLQHNRRMVSPLLKMSDDGIYSYVPDRIGSVFLGNPLAKPFESKNDIGGFNYHGLLQIPFVFGAVMIRSDVVNSIEMPFKTCHVTCNGDDDEECISQNKKNKVQNCETVYYENINGEDQPLWGMMFKQIQEQGIIPFISNEHEYGRIAF